MIFAFFMAMTAYTLLSTGFVLQKKGIDWIGWKGNKDKRFYSSFFIWFSGFFLMNIFGIPSALSLRVLPSYIVSSFAGWGIIVLVFLSALILKEKTYNTDYLLSFLIIAGIVLLSLFQKSDDSSIPSNSIFNYIYFFSPVLLIMIGFSRKFNRKIKSVIFSVTSGTFAGIMVVSLKILVTLYGYRVGRYFGSVYLYLYISAALLSLISIQLAFKNGSMILTGQLQYSSNIIYPVIGSVLIFGNNPGVIQIVSLIIIIFSVIKILKNH